MLKQMTGLALALSLMTTPVWAEDSFPVTITVDAAKSQGPLKPVWRFFGADEPNYATMKDGQKLLDHLGELRPKQVYFRAHNLLNTGDGTPAFKWGSTNAYTEDKDGKPVYNWMITDMIIDSYLDRGVRPYLQIGFMPEALSSAPEGTQYRHSWRPGFKYELIEGGWNYPPNDYKKWEELVYQWTKHNVEKYGKDEVLTWYFEVWNEPNGPSYWKGTPEEFYKTHDYAIAGVKRALPEAKVGGPDVAGSGGAFMDGFLKHVVSGKNYATGETGTPTDFLAFHAKGTPKFIDGHVQMGMVSQLKAVDTGFKKIAAVPELKDTPIVIGESDPEGCAACPGKANGYRNGTMYSSYTAASFARIWELSDRHKVNLEGVLTWAFTFEDQPWFAGYRQLATNGIDLPVLNVFRMYAQFGPERIAASSSAQLPLDDMMATVTQKNDVGVMATRDGSKVAVLVWHYNDDDLKGPDAAVTVNLSGLGKARTRKVTQYLVDPKTANAYTAWQEMGSPQSPNQDQYKVLEAASVMHPTALAPLTVTKGAAKLDLTLVRQGVTLLIVE
ncbi:MULTISPECIES: GH39 family glycosyl hydrolase [Asticcacaulis]|uniref:GH39 family glycosyl hydrolase n=1 Tax=Asticcacaulis TaxID=76890 RepID=UPI001AEAAC42|nr:MULTISPECIES: beta-xylosidase [Asticcacaulis]MBP2159646.1 xylan 1,4-beta-xylosidase [Asticcacaulis solisilvae]MDR6800527.1 xylan 1,4-beta-xylosidase [Asticcacaulis sp. BE141]